MVAIRDPFHREWSDTQLALQRSKLWWLALLTTIVYSMSYGPWESNAWFQKTKEVAQAYWDKASPADLLFQALYERICSDTMQVLVGTLEHKVALVVELEPSNLYTSKGPRVALSR